MKSKAASYSTSDWVMLLALVQAVKDLLTPGSSFHATVAIIFISVILRMARYVYETRNLRWSRWYTMALALVTIMVSVHFMPDLSARLMRISGRWP
ncbi:MAG: hypothetical protein WBX25_12950 [Rhodomicrobium sp.]